MLFQQGYVFEVYPGFSIYVYLEYIWDLKSFYHDKLVLYQEKKAECTFSKGCTTLIHSALKVEKWCNHKCVHISKLPNFCTIFQYLDTTHLYSK